jgi:hypothetical protein
MNKSGDDPGGHVSAPRYAPSLQLPPYAFVPGKDPHPRSHPLGHSFGRPDPEPIFIPSSEWRRNEAWLQGVDLFNMGYFWEAHEAWEFPWHAAKNHEPDQALLLQALIQLTAAALKVPMNQALGLQRLTETGTAKLRELASRHEVFMGLPIADFAEAFATYARQAIAASLTIDRPPPQVLLRLQDQEPSC